MYFLYSNHSLSSFDTSLQESERIKNITLDIYPLFDNLELLIEVDMMIGDFSTLSSECAILEKPQLFVMPDYDKTYKTKGFADDLRSLLPGKEVFGFNEFLLSIHKYCNNTDRFIKEYGDNINNLLDKYIDTSVKDSRNRFEMFICEKIQNI